MDGDSDVLPPLTGGDRRDRRWRRIIAGIVGARNALGTAMHCSKLLLRACVSLA